MRPNPLIPTGIGAEAAAVESTASPLSWEAFRRRADKYDAEIFEQAFCSRGEDEKLWYGEE